MPLHATHDWTVGDVLHTGRVLVGLHCASERQFTQVLIDVLQISPSAVHAVEFEVEHCRHTPLTHAGMVDDGQAYCVAEP